MRKVTRRSFMASAAVGVSFGLSASAARAQDYPNRPVRFIVPRSKRSAAAPT